MIYISDNSYRNISQGLVEEQLEIEWYEVRKSIIKRETSAGRIVQLNREHADFLDDGQVVYQDTSSLIKLCIKPCTSIILHSQDAQMVGQFCFDVGNRHLPIFYLDDGSFAVAYDGRLYSALSAKYVGNIALGPAKLIPKQDLQMLKKSNAK